MKLWFKLFLTTLILFLAAFYTGIYYHAHMVHRASLDAERDQAFAQHNFIMTMLTGDLEARAEDGNNINVAVNAVMRYYAGYYDNRGVRLELLRDGSPLYSRLADQRVREKLHSDADQRQSVIAAYEGRTYIYVSGYMSGEFPDFVLIYARDITDVIEERQVLINRLLVSGVIITLAFMAVLYFILKRLMQPVRVLQTASEQIAAGAYDVRAKIKGSDEIALLGARFNQMADEMLARMEEEKQSGLAKQQFIDNLAHELRTPLTSIFGYAEFLQRANAPEDERIAATDHILQQVQRMQTMSAKLLELSLTRRGLPDREKISLSSCFQRVHDVLRPDLGHKQMHMDISCGDQVIMGTEILIEQLLINLLDNAVQASSEGGSVSLKAYGQETVTIEITDQGKGMEPQQTERVFEPFYRVDAARSRAAGGAGLGLALCRQIADAHNARITIESQPGQGTTVSLFFTNPFSLQSDDMSMKNP